MSTTVAQQRKPYTADWSKWVDQIYRMWEAEPLQGVASQWVFFVFLCLICFVPFWAGPMMQYTYAHDAFIFLDGAWRVINGQRPQVDFSTNLGPVVFLYTAAGLLFTKHGGSALQLAHALMGTTVAGFAYLLCFRRLPQIPGMLLSTLIVLFAMDQHNTGEYPVFLTSGMLYNRVGYALVGIVLVESLIPPRAESGSSRQELWSGAAVGAICSLLLFMKITYFLAAMVIILGLLPVRSQNRLRLAGMAAAQLVCLLIGLAYLHFNTSMLVKEYAMSAGSRLLIPSALIWLFLLGLEANLLLLAISGGAAFLIQSPSRENRPWKYPWAVLVIAFAGFVILISNHQIAGDPLNAFGGIAIAGSLLLSSRTTSRDNHLVAWTVLITLGLLTPAVALAFPSATSYTFSILKSAIHWKGTTPEIRINAPSLSDMMVRDEPPFYDTTGQVVLMGYGKYLNDGFDLLRKNSSPGESVMSLDFSNPFSFGLQRPPQRGGTTCLQHGVTFSDQHWIPADRLFGNVDLVMLPKLFTDGSIPRPIEKLYGKTLKAEFKQVSESKYWQLLRRRT